MNKQIHDIITSLMRLLYASGGIYAPPRFCPCVTVANGDAQLYRESAKIHDIINLINEVIIFVNNIVKEI
jgi:hypothetical protein